MNLNVHVARLVRREKQKASGDHAGGEIELVPLLDIVTNVMLFLLATVATVFTATVHIDAPNGRPSVPAPHEDQLNVAVGATGYVIGSEEGFLQPDCQHFGRFAVAVPTTTPGGDPVSLQRCLRTLRTQPDLTVRFPATRPAVLAGDGNLPYETLVATLDAMRETRQGARDLFPVVRLGVAR